MMKIPFKIKEKANHPEEATNCSNFSDNEELFLLISNSTTNVNLSLLLKNTNRKECDQS